ncbi:transcription elongation factor Rnk [Alcanivorax sp. S71-1-4]|nr:transcription elongation factor Rnk [Alcanivorax sp. S71-1-4]
MTRLVAALDTLLGHADAPDAPRARPGCKVHLLSLHNGEKRHLTLTLPGQDDAGAARISVFSPLGIALLGARAGDIVQARAFGWHERACVLAVTPLPQETLP